MLASLVYHYAFGSRADKNPLLKYFSAEDFNLTTRPVSIKSGKTVLNGFIYTSKSRVAVSPVISNFPSVISSEAEKSIAEAATQTPIPQNLIIFAHGMGPGQIAYTTEIAYLCNHGATVLALDSAGCNFSQGKNIKGMYEGAKTVLAAIDFAKADPQLKNAKISLVGHSWGGYSVLCAAAQRKVEKVIAISAPCTPAKTLKCGAEKIIGKPLAAMLTPFWAAINFFKFGKHGNANAAKCAKTAAQNGVKVVLIHGDADKTVPPANAVYFKVDGGKGIKKHLAKGKAHNPYNTENAESKLQQLNSALLSKKLTAVEKQKFFNEFDFKAATEEDEEVMNLLQ